MAMARSKLDEHRLKETDLNDVKPGETLELGPFDVELIHMTHSIPDAMAVALTTDVGTMLITGDYKFDQTPVDGKPADVSRLAELGPGRAPAAVRRLDQRRPSRLLAERVDRRPATWRTLFGRCEGRIVVTCFASNIHRVQQVVDAAAAHGRKVALVGRSMRKNINIGKIAGAHRRARRHARPAARDRRLPRRQARHHLDRLARASR